MSLILEFWVIYTYLFFLALGHDCMHNAMSLAPSSARSLDESDYALRVVVVDDQVNLTNVQTLLAHTSGDKDIEMTGFEFFYHLKTTVRLLFCAILKIWRAKSSSQIGAFFYPMFAN